MKRLQKVGPVFFYLILTGALVFLSLTIEQAPVQPEALKLLQIIQSPEATVVGRQNRPYSLRQTGFDPKNPQARCMNYAFLQAGEADTRLWAETSLSFSGKPEEIAGMRLSYRVSFLVRQDGLFVEPAPFPKLFSIRRSRCYVASGESVSTASPGETQPQAFCVRQQVFSLGREELKGGRIIGALCQVSGVVRCKDGNFYYPSARIVFALDSPS